MNSSPVIASRTADAEEWLLPVVGLGTLGLVGRLFEGTQPFVQAPFWTALALTAALLLWWQRRVVIPDGCEGILLHRGCFHQSVGPGPHLLGVGATLGAIVDVTREVPHLAHLRLSAVDGPVDLQVLVRGRVADAAGLVLELDHGRALGRRLDEALAEGLRPLVCATTLDRIHDLVGADTRTVLTGVQSALDRLVRITSISVVRAVPEASIGVASASLQLESLVAATAELTAEREHRLELVDRALEAELAPLRAEGEGTEATIAALREQRHAAATAMLVDAEARAEIRTAEIEVASRPAIARLDAQAIDLRSLALAEHPAAAEYCAQRHLLDALESVADNAPQVIADTVEETDLLEMTARLLGLDEELYRLEDLAQLGESSDAVQSRIVRRAALLDPGAEAGDEP